MENAQLIGLSRQMALRRQMDVVANNVANINTNGFKKESVLFEEYVMPVARDRTATYPDQPLSYTQDWATMHDLSPGAIKQTGNTLDVALQGDGLLTVQTPAGERYTRDGALKLNNEGVLVTNSGDPVLSQGGTIQFGPEETDIVIARDGSISSSAGQKGRLRIVSFEQPQELTREAGNLFAGGSPLIDDSTVVVQGALEGSNVSGVAEMTEMIRVNRSYQSLARMMQQQDELRSTAVQRLGDLQA